MRSANERRRYRVMVCHKCYGELAMCVAHFFSSGFPNGCIWNSFASWTWHPWQVLHSLVSARNSTGLPRYVGLIDCRSWPQAGGPSYPRTLFFLHPPKIQIFCQRPRPSDPRPRPFLSKAPLPDPLIHGPPTPCPPPHIWSRYACVVSSTMEIYCISSFHQPLLIWQSFV